MLRLSAGPLAQEEQNRLQGAANIKIVPRSISFGLALTLALTRPVCSSHKLVRQVGCSNSVTLLRFADILRA